MMKKKNLLRNMEKKLAELENDNTDYDNVCTENTEFNEGYTQGAIDVLKIYIALLKK